MVEDLKRQQTGFQRCAVCKIDLKGRFVYVDDRIEELFGYGKDELFGRPVTHFLDDRSSSMIDRLLEERNHYETFFDFARLTIVNNQNNPVEVEAVVSLNFIGGNPANFQLVFKAAAAAEETESASVEFGYRELLEGLLRSDGLSDMREFLRTVVNCCGARAAYAYRMEENGLVPRSGATLSGGDNLDFDAIPEAKKLHQQVADTGRTYAYTDQEHATRAIEEFGFAPCEFITRANVADVPRYVFAIVFAEDTPMEKADRAIAMADLAIQFAARVGEPSRSIAGDDPEVDVKFTVGFLDTLGIGAILLSADGNVVGYNATATTMLEGRRPEGSVMDILDDLQVEGEHSLREQCEAFFGQTNEDESERSWEVRVPSGEMVCLTVIRLSLEPYDRTAFLTFQSKNSQTPDVPTESQEPVS